MLHLIGDSEHKEKGRHTSVAFRGLTVIVSHLVSILTPVVQVCEALVLHPGCTKPKMLRRIQLAYWTFAGSELKEKIIKGLVHSCTS